MVESEIVPDINGDGRELSGHRWLMSQVSLSVS